VPRILLIDDELWRAIADNTDAMSALVHEQVEFEADVGAPIDADSRTIRIRSNAQKIDKFQLEYQDYAAELRRRYP
jgi:predicted secreted protein